MNIDSQLVAIANSIDLNADLNEGKKKKPYNSVTYTTGDPDLNIAHFNKMLSGKEENTHTSGYLNGTIKTDAASPDGASTISSGDAGGSVGESLELDETKRYVRRYYMKPQNLWLSNKDEVLHALIDHEDEDCVIYTLINQGDIKDSSKLNNDDIIYYYEDGILYDKNKVRIMDYNLSIKHEEDREKINPNTTSDAKFADVYADRMTDATNLDEDFLDEDKILVGKINQELDLPPQIHLLDQQIVEKAIATLKPEELFEIGYVNPIYFYAELWNYLPIYKCTEFTGYTGVDFEGSEDDVYKNKQDRIDRANREIADAEINGPKMVGSETNYSLQNKLVSRDSLGKNTIAFYPVGAPKACYFVKLPERTDFLKVTTEQLENYIYAVLPKIEQKLRVDITKAKTKVYNTLYGKSAQDIDRETTDGVELDPKFIKKYNRDKKAFRSLYTSQVYFLKLPNGDQGGQRIAESLFNNENKISLTEAVEFKDINKKKVFNLDQVNKFRELLLNTEITRRIPGSYSTSIVRYTVTKVYVGKDTGDICILCENKNERRVFKFVDFIAKNAKSIYICCEDKELNNKILDMIAEYNIEFNDSAKEANGEQRSAEHTDEKFDDQVSTGHELAKEQSVDLKQWLTEHVTNIKFTLPALENIPFSEKKTIKKINQIFNKLEITYPGITKTRHFGWENKTIAGAIFSFWGLTGFSYFDVPFSSFPLELQNMIKEAKAKSIARGQANIVDAKADDKIINNIYLCHAILDIFNGDYTFCDHNNPIATANLNDPEIEKIDNELNIDFPNIVESLHEEHKHKCCICGEDIIGYGNNAEPYKEGQCCDACNLKFVIPARLDQTMAKKEKDE